TTALSALSLHDALPISSSTAGVFTGGGVILAASLAPVFSSVASEFSLASESVGFNVSSLIPNYPFLSLLSLEQEADDLSPEQIRSEEHTSELQSRENLV